MAAKTPIAQSRPNNLQQRWTVQVYRGLVNYRVGSICCFFGTGQLHFFWLKQSVCGGSSSALNALTLAHWWNDNWKRVCGHGLQMQRLSQACTTQQPASLSLIIRLGTGGSALVLAHWWDNYWGLVCGLSLPKVILVIDLNDTQAHQPPTCSFTQVSRKE